MQNWYLKLAALSGASSVALGAFGAHKLKTLLSERMLEAYETAVFYQFIHSLLLLILALAILNWQTIKALKISAALTTAGIILFSGSLYFMSLTGITDYAILTPIGGLSWILAWLALFVASHFISKPQNTNNE